MFGIFAAFAGVPLLIGLWTSPAERWRELGLTMLIAARIAAVVGASTLLILNDPGAKQFMPPLPEIELAPLFGAVNLLLVAVVGWLLCRGKDTAGS